MKRFVLVAAITVASAAGALVATAGSPTAVALSTGSAGAVVSTSHTFNQTGAEQMYRVPAGVTRVHITATGGYGGEAPGAFAPSGGSPATVSAEVKVKAGSTLYVEVGGSGFIGPTFNGGGAGGDDKSGLPDVISESGGGASDVRTVSMTSCNDCNATLNSRLVAAGGGGGSTEDYAGGNAGAAGLPLGSGGGAVGGGALGLGSEGTTAVGGVCVGGLGGDADGGGGGGGGGALGGGGGGVCDGGAGGTSGFIGGATDTSVSVIAGAISSVTITTGPQPTPSHTFLLTDNEQIYTVPPGTTEVHITAVGGFGGFDGGSPGGASDTAQADLKVKPGQKLYVEVGGDGTSETGLMGSAAGGGGWPDGGNGGPGALPAHFGGAGGGGDSDVRTVSLPDTCVACTKSLKSRVVVAGGGGGASRSASGGAAGQNGQPSIGGGAAGAAGLGFGGAGTAGGVDAANPGDGGGGGGGGVDGGGGGGVGAGGGGGTSGFFGATVNRSITPTAATPDFHPSVTIVPDVTLTVAHAGKGVGVVTAPKTHCGEQCALVEPPGKVVTLTATPKLGSVFARWSGFTGWFPGDGCRTRPVCTFTMDNSITITATYRFKPRPRTRFGTIDIEGRSASFHFTASGVATHFQCALTTADHRVKWHACKSPKRYSHLKNATYTFRVRAIGPQGPDRSPAKRVFRVT
jgi:hypothetical protein